MAVTQRFHIRSAEPADRAALRGLLRQSYAALLPAAYPADLVAAALPRLVEPDYRLTGTATWYVAEMGSGLIGCGGWTLIDRQAADGRWAWAELRQFATHPDWTRQGVASALLSRSERIARACGARWLLADASLAAVSFYDAHGFVARRPGRMRIGPGLVFETVVMARDL